VPLVFDTLAITTGPFSFRVTATDSGAVSWVFLEATVFGPVVMANVSKKSGTVTVKPIA
jgi:hypothetical protein